MIKIVITRPVDSVKGTLELAEQKGFNTISFPLLRLNPLNRIILNRPVDAYSWIIFTSSNSVRFFIEYCGKKKINLSGKFKIAAVGQTTERSLNGYGLKANFVPVTFNRKAIGEQIPVSAGDLILYPSLLYGSSSIENILQQRNCLVERLNVYESVPIIYSKDKWQQLANSKPDILTFFSPRTVQAFFKNRQKVIDLNKYIIAVLAESSAEELIRFGYSAQIKTDIPTAENLLHKINEYYA